MSCTVPSDKQKELFWGLVLQIYVAHLVEFNPIGNSKSSSNFELEKPICFTSASEKIIGLKTPTVTFDSAKQVAVIHFNAGQLTHRPACCIILSNDGSTVSFDVSSFGRKIRRQRKSSTVE